MRSFVPCRTWSRPWTDGTGCWGCSISWKNVSGLWFNPANNQYYIHWQMPPSLQINWMIRYCKIKKVDHSSSNLILGIKFAILAIQSLWTLFSPLLVYFLPITRCQANFLPDKGYMYAQSLVNKYTTQEHNRFRATINFQNFKVALNLKYRVFRKYAKSCVFYAHQNW